MKDVLVLIASVILGIALAVMVMNFKAPAEKAANYTNEKISTFFETATGSALDIPNKF